MIDLTLIDWNDGIWLNPPPSTSMTNGQLIVEAAEGSDFWRLTGYGFARDSGHALLIPFPLDSAMEVTFRADFEQLYDQAGILIRVDEGNWIKAGVEVTDGEPHVAAVATREFSDWSLAPVLSWRDHLVTVRASRSNNAVTIRARTQDSPWQTIRLAYLPADAIATAGPMCCSPERGGLRVTFTQFATGAADEDLHSQPD